MAGGRFVIAGGILFLIARFSKDYEKPKFVHWKTSFIVGTLLLLGGNGGVVFAEKYISSSLAALLVATEPFWIVLLSWLWLKKSRPNLKTVAGIALGFFGVWLLIRGQMETAASSDSMQFFASLAIIAAAMSWAIGSIYGLRAPVPKSSILTAGMQMFSGGLVLLFVSLMTGEMFRFDIAQVSNNFVVRRDLPDNFRFADRIYGLQLAAQKRAADDGFDLRIHQSGHCRFSRLADRR